MVLNVRNANSEDEDALMMAGLIMDVDTLTSLLQKGMHKYLLGMLIWYDMKRSEES